MYSMAGKSNIQDKNFVPGPGTYNPGSGEQTGLSYSFRNKGEAIEQRFGLVPGPGAYNPKAWENEKTVT